jgi:hypothetical protein
MGSDPKNRSIVDFVGMPGEEGMKAAPNGAQVRCVL